MVIYDRKIGNNIGFIKYVQRNLGPFGSKYKCVYCGKNLKNEVVEALEHVHYMGKDYEPIYFCLGHMEAWAKKQRREYLLTKL